MGKAYNVDRCEETDDAIRFAHEGGTQWASADNNKKNKLDQLNSQCNEDILKGYFGQNKKQNISHMLLGRTRRDDPTVTKLVDKACIFSFLHKLVLPT